MTESSRLILARIRGGVDVGARAIYDAPYPPGKLRLAWIDGHLTAAAARVAECVSAAARISALAALFPVQPRDAMPWLAAEQLIIARARVLGFAAGAIGALLGRSPRAVRVKACRLGLAAPERRDGSRGGVAAAATCAATPAVSP